MVCLMLVSFGYPRLAVLATGQHYDAYFAMPPVSSPATPCRYLGVTVGSVDLRWQLDFAARTVKVGFTVDRGIYGSATSPLAAIKIRHRLRAAGRSRSNPRGAGYGDLNPLGAEHDSLHVE